MATINKVTASDGQTYDIGGFGVCTPIADANTALTGGLYCPASTSATNFPGDLTDQCRGTLYVTTYPGAQGEVIAQQVYYENDPTWKNGIGGRAWMRTYYSTYDPMFQVDEHKFSSWALISTDDLNASRPNTAPDGVRMIYNELPSTSGGFPSQITDPVYGIIITRTSRFARTNDLQATQFLIDYRTGVYFRVKSATTGWGSWKRIAWDA